MHSRMPSSPSTISVPKIASNFWLILATAEEIWEEMAAIANSTYRGVALSLCVRLQELLNRLRLCPSALQWCSPRYLTACASYSGEPSRPILLRAFYGARVALPSGGSRAWDASQRPYCNNTRLVTFDDGIAFTALPRSAADSRRWSTGTILGWLGFGLCAAKTLALCLDQRAQLRIRRSQSSRLRWPPSWMCTPSKGEFGIVQNSLTVSIVRHVFLYRLRRRTRSATEAFVCSDIMRDAQCGHRPRTLRFPSLGSAGKSKPHFRAYLMLWLLIFPCNGVQIWQQSTLQGQPVFATSSVQPAANVQDLQPVRTPNTPLVEPLLRAGPQARRTICVYRPQATEQPTVLISDDRAHGQLLHRMVCSAYGLVVSDWCLRRLVEALPSLPPEQYVLSPAQIPWDQTLAPV